MLRPCAFSFQTCEYPVQIEYSSHKQCSCEGLIKVLRPKVIPHVNSITMPSHLFSMWVLISQDRMSSYHCLGRCRMVSRRTAKLAAAGTRT